MRSSILSALVLVATAYAAPLQKDATCAALPATFPTTVVPKLNDPFTLLSGAKVVTKDDWSCRRAEISAMIQRDELGTLPPKPDTVTGSITGNTLTVTVTNAGKTISFNVAMSVPAGDGPFPAIIGIGGVSIPRPAGVAILTLPNDDIAAQQDGTSRGKGKFYTLYGSNASAGAMTAWAWGVGRLIDALETTPGHKINLQRLGVSGCSRNGKGALVAGAFEERIRLTIPQESGSGGAACWRLSDAQQARGQTVQTAGEIVNENVWFSTALNQFSTSTTKLPFDHHMLAGMVAPRALFSIENNIDWLGVMSTFGCMTAAHTIYEALGIPDSMGFSQVGNHAHCAFPASQQTDLDSFINKFLLDKPAGATNFVKTDQTNIGFTRSDWITYAIPTLV